jgi:hypothetical protein
MSELAEKIPAIEGEVVLCERFGCRTDAKMFVKRGVERRAYCICHALESIGTGGKLDAHVCEQSVMDDTPVEPAKPVEVIEDKSYSPISPYGQAFFSLSLPKSKHHQAVAV